MSKDPNRWWNIDGKRAVNVDHIAWIYDNGEYTQVYLVGDDEPFEIHQPYPRVLEVLANWDKEEQ